MRDDNVRLERELCLSHEQLECAKSELAALRLSIEHSDAAALKARNDNQRCEFGTTEVGLLAAFALCLRAEGGLKLAGNRRDGRAVVVQWVEEWRGQMERLMEQLERALFEKEQTLAMAGEGREAATRVIALERSIAVLKSEHAERMKQALEDLEASEHKLRVLKDSAEQDRNQREEAVGKMESLRSRFELAAQEIESLTRSIEEVRHLESALEKSRTEQTALYEELTSQRSLLDRVLAEKDALLDQLTALNGQLDERTNRLRQVGEAKMDTTLRIVELESQVAALLRERDGVAGESEFNRASCNELTANISGPGAESAKQVAVQIEGNIRPGEVERLRLDLQKAQERIAELEEFEGSVGDNHVLNADTSRSSDRLEGSEWPYQFISASTPFPSLVTLLSRRFSAFRHRPARALMPYFRLAMAAYSILLHIMLIHCWFFAVCP
ncbi:unnamed protein product [Heligmosomoides polygyrus]|uniref:Golgin-84 n=1 Tax=Heligmosomoides polygyrus TaxID=6339 RepID=A0A3P8EAJ9_HELPZ|nr:unnamed protein product [Heligmosomoides polygyrus]